MKTEIKMKQFFALTLISMFSFLLLCATGCESGGKSCEPIRCESKSDKNNKLMGLSIPGCGGLFSPGRGCGFDTCGLWSQRIIGIIGVEKIKQNEKSFILGVDNHYYKNEGCISSCSDANKLKSCHALVIFGGGNYLISLGRPSGELYIGCVDGSCGFGACSNGPGALGVTQAEMLLFKDY